MNTQPKKFLIFHILDILKRYTDEDHQLSQKEIGEILEREYDMKADRKSIRRNLLDLIDLGYDVGCSQSVRVNCGSSLTVCCSPSTFPTASAGNWRKSWKDFPAGTSRPG